MTKSLIGWEDTDNIDAHDFTCWQCGCYVAADSGYKGRTFEPSKTIRQTPCIHICPRCFYPNFSIIEYDFGRRRRRVIETHPAPPFGNNVDNLPDEIHTLYEEARRCLTVEAYRAAVLCCRTLIFCVAANLGEKAGTPFDACIKFLINEKFIPERHEPGVQVIRDIGSDGAHKIQGISRKRAEASIYFTEIMLRNIYEYTARADLHFPKNRPAKTAKTKKKK